MPTIQQPSLLGEYRFEQRREAAPWQHAKNVSGSDRDLYLTAQRRLSRRFRYELLRHLWGGKVTEEQPWRGGSIFDHVRKCSRLPAPYVDEGLQQVQVRVNSAGSASFLGLQRCGSVHACPVCAAGIRERKARKVQRLLTRHLKAGGGAYMVTLTIRHQHGMTLERLWGLVADSWRGVQTGHHSKWRDLYGVVGMVRALEVTTGANGWHPHLHVLVLTDRVLDAAEEWAMIDAEALYVPVKAGSRVHRLATPSGLWHRWRDAVALADGDCTPSRRRGITVEALRSAEASAKYVCKVQDDGLRESYVHPGRELARMDTKRGRGKGRTPFQVLADAAATGDAEDWAIWHEWETASHRHQAITTTPGLWDYADSLPPVEGEEDDPDDGEHWTGWTFGTADLDLMTRKGLHSAVLDAAEREGPFGVSRVLLQAAGLTPDDSGCQACAHHERLCPHHFELMWALRV